MLRDGSEGDSAIELYDWEMNTAPVTFETQTRPVHKVTLTDTRRQAVVVKKGDIGAFEMVQARESGSDTYAQTLFYTEAETDADGAKAYKLKGLRIDNKPLNAPAEAFLAALRSCHVCCRVTASSL